jgi:hypothetical protein
MTTKPAIGHNTKRSLDAIGTDLRKLRNIFDSGELLVEASEACEHGEWLDWLETYFDASQDTAYRHMASYRLSLKFRTVRNLKVPPSIIYKLAWKTDNPDLPAIIEALNKASKSAGNLSVVDAEQVIDLTELRIKFGDHPTATLFALNENIPDDAEWAAGASEELKKERPTSAEAAEKIVLAHRRKHLEELFGGALPDWLGEMMLDHLDDVEPEHRKKVLQKLQGASHPLAWRQVAEITDDGDEDGDEDQDDDAEIEPTPEQTDGREYREAMAIRAEIAADFAAIKAEAEQIAADLIKLDRNLAQRLYAQLAGGESWLKAALGRGLEGDAVEEAKLEGNGAGSHCAIR